MRNSLTKTKPSKGMKSHGSSQALSEWWCWCFWVEVKSKKMFVALMLGSLFSCHTIPPHFTDGVIMGLEGTAAFYHWELYSTAGPMEGRSDCWLMDPQDNSLLSQDENLNMATWQRKLSCPEYCYDFVWTICLSVCIAKCKHQQNQRETESLCFQHRSFVFECIRYSP